MPTAYYHCLRVMCDGCRMFARCAKCYLRGESRANGGYHLPMFTSNTVMLCEGCRAEQRWRYKIKVDLIHHKKGG